MLEHLSILTYQSVKIVKWRQSAGKIAKAKPSETTRKTPKGDDIVRPLQRCKEIDRNDQSARKSSNKSQTNAPNVGEVLLLKYMLNVTVATNVELR